MSSKDINDVHDAEFEAFLQGKGELANLLHAIPQPTPSAELDAAVLAGAEAALTHRTAPLAAAANDPVIPSAQRMAPRFPSRWKVPLGLAASVLLAIPLLMLKSREQANDAAKIVAAAPASPAPAALSPENLPAEARAKQAGKDADYSQLAKAEATMPVQPKWRAAPAPPTAAGKIAPSATAHPDPKSENTLPPLARAGTPDAKAEPIIVAQGPVSEPIPSTTAAASAAVQERVFSTPPTAPIRPAESADTATGDKSAEILAQADNPEAKAKRSAAPQARSYSAAPALAAAPVVAAAPLPAPAVAAAPSPMAASGIVDAGSVGAKPPAPPAKTAAQSNGSASAEPAKTWLLRIEKLIKADRRQEALDEWEKFRRAYPDYPAQKSLLKQMETLKQ